MRRSHMKHKDNCVSGDKKKLYQHKYNSDKIMLMKVQD